MDHETVEEPREAEERLRLALEAGGLGTWVWTIDEETVRWSEGLERIHGLRPGEFPGTFEAFVADMHPDDRERVLAAIRRSVESGEDYAVEYRIVRPDGAVRWLAAQGKPLDVLEGSVRSMVGVCTDITTRREGERRRAAQYGVTRAIAEADTIEEATPRILRQIGEALDWQLGLLWRVDAERWTLRCTGVWVAPSTNAEAFIAMSLDTTFSPGIGLPGRVWETGHAAWIDDVLRDENFPRAPVAAREGLHAAFSFPLTRGADVLGVIEFFSHEIREPDDDLRRMLDSLGSQIGQFVGRAAVESARRASEARTVAILHSALDGIVTIDQEGRILEFNPAAEEMFGYARDEVVGKEMADVIVPPSLRDRHREALARYVDTGRATIMGRRIELSGLRAGGTEFPLELAITRVDVPGPPVFTGFIRDITDRRLAEEGRAELLAQERSAREQAEDARERLAFLADASVVLTTAVDRRERLSRLARLVVPKLADWCSIIAVEGDGSIDPIEVAHVDPTKVEMAKEYGRRYPPDPRVGVVAEVIRTGSAQLFPEIDEELLERTVDDPVQLAFARSLGLRSGMVVPLVARGRVLGVISFVSAESGRRYSETDLVLAEELARRAALVIDNAKLYEERSHVAETLQRSLLPPTIPEIAGVDVATLYRPVGEVAQVGGDFYDVFSIDDRTWTVVIGDVSGKGVEAAAVTGLARHTVRAVAQRESSPGDVLASLDRALIEADGERFCTLAIGIFSPASEGMEVTVACGGHPPPLIRRVDGTIEAAAETGMVVGVLDGASWSSRRSVLTSGDLIVFYTDGLIDPRRSRPLDEGELAVCLSECRDLDAAGTLERLEQAIAAPADQAPDDVAIVVVRVT